MSVKTPKKEPRSEQVTRVNPGEVLSRARKEQGLALEEVMLHLGITKRVLYALEHDEYDGLPSPIYVKGYIKRYCSILKIPHEEVLIGFDSRMEELGLGLSEPSVRLDRIPRKKFQPWFLIIPVALIVLVAFLLWSIFSDDSESSTADDSIETLSQEMLSERGATQLTTAPQILQGEDKVEVSVDINDAKLRPHRPVTPGTQILQINVVQQSWIEILDAQGDILLADLKQSGYQGEVSGLTPFEVILGNAPGVILNFNGEPVAVPHIGNDNTAKFKIGDTEEG
jgi:cytoskeleton protein RodZ